MSEILINSKVNLGGKEVSNVGNLQFDTEEHKDNFKEYLGVSSNGNIAANVIELTQDEYDILEDNNPGISFLDSFKILKSEAITALVTVEVTTDNEEEIYNLATISRKVLIGESIVYIMTNDAEFFYLDHYTSQLNINSTGLSDDYLYDIQTAADQ